MTDPFNPRPCCILGVCCPPENSDSEAKRATALGEMLDDAFPSSAGQLLAGNAGVAAWILDRFDLVPKGLGAAIVSAYEPFFKQKIRKG